MTDAPEARRSDPVFRMDHVSVVVEDLDAAVAFFSELGMAIEGSAPIEGEWVDRINGLEGIRIEVVMMRTPDGNGRLELTRFLAPPLVEASPDPAPPNTIGYRSVMFQVDDVDDVVTRLERHGGQLMGEIVRYEDVYRLCYLRGPAGIIVSLAEPLGGATDGQDGG